MIDQLIQLLIEKTKAKCGRRMFDGRSCPEVDARYNEWCAGCLAYEIENMRVKEHSERETNRKPFSW